MVIDTSALLAIFFNETRGPWCAERLQENRDNLRMSTVNLAEALIRIQDRQPVEFKKIREEILSSPIQWESPDADQAVLVAAARIKYPINLGDCFAYALAKSLQEPLLTLDMDFKKTDVKIIFPK